MERLSLSFYECEHNEDMEDYIYDIGSSGGIIIDQVLNEDAEYCTITFDIENKSDFITKFKKTDSFEFID